MPGKDGTGPLGQGADTGRGMGPCGAGKARGRGNNRGTRRGYNRPADDNSSPTKEEEAKN